MNKKRSRKRKRNCVKPEEIWDAIDGCIDSYKKEAIKQYPNMNLSKSDMIHAATGNFISGNVESCRPQPKLYQDWVNGEKVSINMILDSMGDVGIVLGAATFRLAEQLEIELPDNAIPNTLCAVVPVINGEFRDDLASIDSRVSNCYLDYVFQDTKAMLCHKVYLAKHLKQRYECENNQIGCEIIDELFIMDISCPSFSIAIFCCMKLLLEDEPIIEILKEMLQDAQSRKKQLKQLSKDEIPEKDKGVAWLDVLSCIHGCEKILGLLANKAA